MENAVEVTPEVRAARRALDDCRCPICFCEKCKAPKPEPVDEDVSAVKCAACEHVFVVPD